MYYYNTNQMYPSFLHLRTPHILSEGGITLKRAKKWFSKDTNNLIPFIHKAQIYIQYVNRCTIYLRY